MGLSCLYGFVFQKTISELEDKYKKAMMNNASLDNEKQTYRLVCLRIAVTLLYCNTKAVIIWLNLSDFRANTIFNSAKFVRIYKSIFKVRNSCRIVKYQSHAIMVVC